jgi:hypothetical protein
MLTGPVPGRGTAEVGAAQANSGAATELSISDCWNWPGPVLPDGDGLGEVDGLDDGEVDGLVEGLEDGLVDGLEDGLDDALEVGHGDGDGGGGLPPEPVAVTLVGAM